MVTTVIAIYSAVVATASVLFGGWVYISGQPRVQARAYLSRNRDGDSCNWHIALRVWNTGRQSIKLSIMGLTLTERREFVPYRTSGLRLDWEGAEVPLMLAGYSGEF